MPELADDFERSPCRLAVGSSSRAALPQAAQRGSRRPTRLATARPSRPAATPAAAARVGRWCRRHGSRANPAWLSSGPHPCATGSCRRASRRWRQRRCACRWQPRRSLARRQSCTLGTTDRAAIESRGQHEVENAAAAEAKTGEGQTWVPAPRRQSFGDPIGLQAARARSHRRRGELRGAPLAAPRKRGHRARRQLRGSPCKSRSRPQTRLKHPIDALEGSAAASLDCSC